MHKKRRSLAAHASCAVAGGRGLKDSEGVSFLHELAELLQAEIIATRGAVEEGLLEEWRLVGMSGARIQTDIYLAFGLSGTNYHTAGVKGSPFIFAVNTDPRARIMGLADLPITGDAVTVLKRLIIKCRQKQDRIQNADKAEFLRILKDIFEEIREEESYVSTASGC